MRQRAVTIAFHNRPFEGMGIVPDRCTTPARFTHDPHERAGADALLVHMPTIAAEDLQVLVRRARTSKPPGQLWVAWSLESPIMCPALQRPEVMAAFDLTMSFDRSSDVWHPYLGPGLVAQLARPQPVEHEATPVAWLQSNPNDATGRAGYVAELMRRVRVDSYGSVMRTRPEVIAAGADARIDRYRRYKFVLAFENSYATDYVTEKIFDVLRAGAVPVYRGCAEVADLLPSPDCFIDSRDFASATALGDHIDHLDRDDEARARYQRWRDEPYQPSFVAILDQLREPPLCRLAAAVSRRLAEARVTTTTERPAPSS